MFTARPFSRRATTAAVVLAIIFSFTASLVPVPAHGSACCSGTGDFGLDGRWANQNPKPQEVQTVALENASTASSRAFYAEINKAFGKAWVEKTNYNLALTGSHGPSFAHLRTIFAANPPATRAEPDIVTFDSPAAIDALAAAKLLPENWRTRLPNASVPFTTTLVFLVRKGNPKTVHDWADLARSEITSVLPDPRNSSIGQWVFLATWAFAAERTNGDASRAREIVFATYQNAAALHSSANAATNAFLQHPTADVLVLPENEAYARRDAGEFRDNFEIVVPPASLRVELPVAWLDRYTIKHETTRVSASLLLYLFTAEAQETAARHHLRPTAPKIAQKTATAFPSLRIITLDDAFGGWDSASKRFFAPKAELEREYTRLTTRKVQAIAPRPAFQRRAKPRPAVPPQ